MRISIEDAEKCIDLIGECTECWDTPGIWQDHLTMGIESLIGGCAAVLGVSRYNGGVEVVDSRISPADPGLCGKFTDYLAEGAFANLPEFDVIMPVVLSQRELVYAQRDVVPRAQYYRSSFYQKYMRSNGIVDNLTAIQLQDGLVVGLGLARERGDAAFSDRDHAVLTLLTRTIARRLGRPLAIAGHRGRQSLSPRLTQTLEAVLDGASEKEIALALGITPATAHEYVRALYRHFRVRTRAQLMAYFLRRSPREA